VSSRPSRLEWARARVRAAQIGGDDRSGVAADSISHEPPLLEGDESISGRPRPPDPATPTRSPSTARVPTVAAGLGVPPALVAAAAWSVCLLAVAVLVWQVFALLARFGDVTLPLAISLLTAAFASPAVDLLERLGVRRTIGALVVVLTGLVLFGGLFVLIGRQVADQVDDLSRDVAEGLLQVRNWLQTGPVGLSDAQLDDFVNQGVRSLQNADAEVLRRAAAVSTSLGQAVAGFFIVAFATYFFCAQGSSIWRWLVGLLPGTVRRQVDSSGRVAWVSLTAFVRATVMVALTDAVGIGLGAVLLGVPLALPLAVLVFIGAFVPIIGAAVSGVVAVLVALVAQGPFVAGVMLGVVLVVQQVESHVLQPFLMGRFVAVHPLVIILTIAVGLTAGGVAGALISVPLVACAHAVGKHVRGTDPEHDPAPDPDHDPAYGGSPAGDAGQGPG